MLLDKVQNLFNRQNIRIVFFFDPEGEYADSLDQFEGSDINLIQVDERYFWLKHELEHNLSKQRVLLYHPFAKPAGESLKSYPLFDLLLANCELLINAEAEFLEFFSLKPHNLELVSKYWSQLKKKETQQKLAGILNNDDFREDNLRRGLVSLDLRFNKIETKSLCVTQWLSHALDESVFEDCNRRLKNNGLEEVFLKWIYQLTEISAKQLNLDLAKHAAAKIYYNLLTAEVERPNAADQYKSFKIAGMVERHRINELFEEWKGNTKLSTTIDSVFTTLASAIEPYKILLWYQKELKGLGYYTVDMQLLVADNLYSQLEGNPYKVREESLAWLKEPQVSARVVGHFELISYSAVVYNTLSVFGSFVFETPEAYISNYKDELYRIDWAFRKALLAYEKVAEESSDLSQTAHALFVNLNLKYEEYLKNLNREWQKILSEKKFNTSKIEVAKQYCFYDTYVANQEHKVAVIISDALRYEVGNELFEQLLKDSRNSVEIDVMLTSLPSETSLGMSNLLPHNKLDLEVSNELMGYRIDGISTASPYRGDILKRYNANSATISFAELVALNKDGIREVVRPLDILYVYHNRIDAEGDQRKTEHGTVSAVEKAIEELSKVIARLTGDGNISHVIVTADHGFLYNYREITEAYKEDLPKMVNPVATGSRFVIAEKFETKHDIFELNSTFNVDSNLKVAVPKSVNRFRRQGNIGLQYVHGGCSLQEMLVPVVNLYKKKKDVIGTVSLQRIDGVTKISGGKLNITIIQEQAVSNEFRGRDVVIGLYSDTGELISNEYALILNSTEKNATERTFKLVLALTASGSKLNFCRLKIWDSKDTNRLNPLVDDRLTINTLIENDDW